MVTVTTDKATTIAVRVLDKKGAAVVNKKLQQITFINYIKLQTKIAFLSIEKQQEPFNLLKPL